MSFLGKLFAALLSGLWGWLGGKLFGDPAINAAEKLGKTEVQRDDADAQITAIDTAQAARERVDTELAAHPGGVRGLSDPDASAYDPNGTG